MPRKCCGIGIIISITLGLLTATVPASAQTYDLLAQFDTVNNPATTGGWSYGYRENPGSAFQLLTYRYSDSGSTLGGWAADASTYPDVEYTTYASTNQITFAQAATTAAAPIIRWTAPSSGTYSIELAFSPFNAFGTSGSTDIFVAQNNVTLYQQNLTGTGGTLTYNATLTFATGDTLDLINDRGTNPGKRVIANATITTAVITPEPGTLGLAALPLLPFAACVARRRNTKQKAPT